MAHVKATVKDVQQADFIRLINTLHGIGIAPKAIEFGGLARFALLATVSDLSCKSCKRAALGALTPLKVSVTYYATTNQGEIDPAKITFAEILEVFWRVHDPTTLNRQGPDKGTQYRSAIFIGDAAQKETAERMKKALDASGDWPDPVVTEITALDRFFPAGEKHRDYYRRNPDRPYCSRVITPKMEKFRKAFKDKLQGKRRCP